MVRLFLLKLWKPDAQIKLWARTPTEDARENLPASTILGGHWPFWVLSVVWPLLDHGLSSAGFLPFTYIRFFFCKDAHCLCVSPQIMTDQ